MAKCSHRPGARSAQRKNAPANDRNRADPAMDALKPNQCTGMPSTRTVNCAIATEILSSEISNIDTACDLLLDQIEGWSDLYRAGRVQYLLEAIGSHLTELMRAQELLEGLHPAMLGRTSIETA